MGAILVAVMVLAVVTVTAWAVYRRRSGGAGMRELDERLKQFSLDRFASPGGLAGLALDKKARKVLFMGQGRLRRVVGYREILAVALREDGFLVTGTVAAGNRGLTPQAKASLVSGLAEAGQGSAPRRVGRMVLEVVLAEEAEPGWSLVFLHQDGQGISRDQAQYAQARTQADHWAALLQVIIKQADDEETKPRDGTWQSSVVR